MSLWQRMRTLFSYAAAGDSPIRPQPVTLLQSVDTELHTSDRSKVTVRSRDVAHEFSLVKWALEKHADYTSRFAFQSQTGIDDLDNRIESIIYRWGLQGNFDVTGRYTLSEFMRNIELARTIDGDIGILKLANGQVQGIEGDRIRNPNDNDSNERWTHGVQQNAAGADTAYCIHKRLRYGGFAPERIVSAQHMFLHRYNPPGRFDSVRGIGLLTSALNTFRDVYQSFDYAMAKAKLTQMFGLKFKRNDDLTELGEERAMSLKGNANYLIELAPDEDLEAVESAQPSNQFQDYTKLMMMVALKSLSINYSMFDESFTNFYGSRAGITQYVESCKPKREQNQSLLNRLTQWKLAREIVSGRLVLPDGMTLNDVYFEWTPAGLPWWKPEEEVKGLLMSITAGFDSYSGVCRLLGKEFKDIIDERKRNEEYARRQGVILPTTQENQGFYQNV